MSAGFAEVVARERQSILVALVTASACGGDPPAFPEPASTTSSGGPHADDGASLGSGEATTAAGGSETGGSETTAHVDTATPGDTSTGDGPPPIVCRDSDGLCHSALAPVMLPQAADAIDAGDLDGDGAIDLVVVDYAESVGVLHGLGDGTFDVPNEWMGLDGSNASAVVVAQLDEDTALDVAVAMTGNDEVTLLRGDGAGGLQEWMTLEAGQNPVGIVDGDFDVNGLVDLAVVHQPDQDLRIYLGDSASPGGFIPLPDLFVAARPTSLVASSMPDGTLALVATSRVDHEIALLTGSAAGDFALASISVGSLPIHADVADLEGDGLPELVTVHDGSSGIAVWRPSPRGNWTPIDEYEVLGSPEDAALVDMNLDGIVDVVACGTGARGIAIVQGRADGTFAAPVVYESGIDQRHLVVADFNGDDIPDAASVGVEPVALFVVVSHAAL